MIEFFEQQPMKCPDCESYLGQWELMVTHLQHYHGYTPEASKYRSTNMFQFQREEWERLMKKQFANQFR